MSFLGNLIWFIFGGFWQGLAWWLSGILCCITIVGIPLGRQCFKFAKLAALPFGKKVEYGGGIVSFFANIIWLIVCGLPMALGSAANGIIFYITIIGIPFGHQCFKNAKLALMPFGSKIIK